ncbi:dehydrogenase/reductase SDR family member 4-like [Styela clava]
MFRTTTLLKLVSFRPSRFISSASNKPGNLDGRVAIVTAGTDGIGLAIAKRLGQNGANVVVSSRKQENVDRAVDEMKTLGYKASGVTCHFGKPEDRKKLVEFTMNEYGSINILVSNAGVNPHPFDIMNTPESVIDKTLELHIKANFQMIQEITPFMAKSDYQGSIVLTSSVASYVTHLYPGIYGITKAAVNAMARGFMPDLQKLNIRINCIPIGGIETKFLQEAKRNSEAKEIFLSHLPMGRFGTPEECAGLAAFLASDDSSYITGENFVIAGGVYTRP